MKRKIGNAIVVGAGIGGIRAALDLAEYGYGVTLVDRAPHLGGILSRLDCQFPTDHCGMCRMLPLVERDAASQHCLRRGLFHENIEILFSTTIAGIEGEPGKFRVTLKQQPSWVDPGRCVGCGRCMPVCPVKVRDTFNMGLTQRKAIYLPVPHSIPNAYVIDREACTRCGACLTVCPTDAIRMPETERRKFHILVVDDELAVRDSLKEWLEAEGFSAAMAASGAEALNLLLAAPYHLMLLDIKMPGMDGVEVLERAKALAPELTVIMMTAYATVETAVEAMKIGALDYLVKPFELEGLMPKVEKVYQKIETAEARQIEAGAVVLCGGTDFWDPAAGKNTLGYGVAPDIVTQIEFERLLSGTGPTAGRIVRLSDGRPVRKIAWLQCVGSRDVQLEADFCSSFCCMASIKEAVLAKERSEGKLETAIFFMDMRTFGKTFQRYRDQAERQYGVRFERARAHSVVADPAGGALVIRWADASGACRDESFDMVVLAAGQRPAAGSVELAGRLDLPLNPWGFIEPEPFSLSRTRQPGIFIGGAFGGMKDIGEAVILASSAAAGASRVIHAAGGSLAIEESVPEAPMSLMRESPRILTVVCRCSSGEAGVAPSALALRSLSSDPEIAAVETVAGLCTASGWEQFAGRIREVKPNRVLIGACLPHLHRRRLQEFSRELGMNAALMEVVDIAPWSFPLAGEPLADALAKLRAGAARLKWADPAPAVEIRIAPRALVAGGGIAGMTAALAIADHGYEVDLVEASDRLGGNLNWLGRTLEGQDVTALLKNHLKRVEKHPRIHVHIGSRVIHAAGEVGSFSTVVEGPAKEVQTLAHGVVILATGGAEASTRSHAYGAGPAVLTQSELERRMADGSLDAGGLDTVVMIQCVDSRQEPRNYCSRVCCATALKHALALKEKNSQLNVFVLHRDVMAYGFAEAAFTRARLAGVVFIPYDPDRPPQVEPAETGATVTVAEPILGRTLAIEAQLVVLATGIVPRLPPELAEAYGAHLDRDGFFQEADSKWRPVDSLKEGVFACGLTLGPRNITESVATAEAAAQRALRLLSRKRLAAGRGMAGVRHSLCSLCEQCIAACPYGARCLDVDLEQVRVNPAMCQGCGACAAVCPNDASFIEGYAPQQMLATIDAAMG
jgi:heterodisulfide reductase subunit A2